MGGAGAKSEVDERVSAIAETIQITTSEYDKEKL